MSDKPKTGLSLKETVCRLNDQQKTIAALREALEIKDQFLACYKTGGRPSEKLWKRLEKNKTALRETKIEGEKGE